MLRMSPWGAGYKDFCIFVFSPFRKIFRCFNFLGGYWNFWWPRLDSLKDGIMFAESGVANERVTTSSGHNIYRISVAGYKDFCIFVFSPFRNIFRCFNFLNG